ncbi:MAG: CAP domain-containing protein [Lachnospiraceae bacterium]|nr:CAP domain-containing protein [Lachnospiraceae bacterium]
MSKTIGHVIAAAFIIFFTAVTLFTSLMCVIASDAPSVDSQMLASINNLRTTRGLGALSVDPTLSSIAETRAKEASSVWSHTRPNGMQGADMIDRTKWRGENLSYVVVSNFDGSESISAAAASTMFSKLCASPTHYDNMVFTNFTKIGIATCAIQTAGGTKITTAYMFSN